MKLNRRNAVAVLCGLTLAAPAFAADAGGGFKLGGFADGRFAWNSATSNTSGFSVADGAVRMSHEMGGSSFAVDLPFFTAGAGNNTFSVGTTKAQAYVQHKYDGGIWWKLGQFDSVLGVDGNDTDEFFFTSASLMDQNIDLQMTHTGLMAGWAGSGFGFNVMIANLRNLGNNSTQQGLDLLGQLTFGQGNITGKVGFMFNFQGATNGHLLDASLGFKSGELMADVGFMMLLGKTGTTNWGFNVAPVYQASDKLGIGARFSMTNVNSASSFDIAAGPRYSFTKNLDGRLMWNMLSAGTTTQNIVASGVYHL